MKTVNNFDVVNLVGSSGLSFDNTIPKHLTHKKQIENVYCTSMQQISEDEFLVGAFIPQTNMFFRQCPEPEERNVLLLTEIGRQAAIACSHEFLGVPFDKAFVLDRFEIHAQAAHVANEMLSPEPLVVRIKMRDQVISAKEELVSVSTDFEFYQEGRLISGGISNWSFHDKARYKKLRSIMRRRMKSKANSEDVVENSNVIPFEAIDYSKVLKSLVQKEGDIYATDLVVDEKHIFFFEHGCDHAPGMLILEAFKQIASRAVEEKLGLPKRSMRTHEIALNFSCFAELDYRSVISVDLSSAKIGKDFVVSGIKVDARQNGQVLAEGELAVSKQR